MSDGQTPVIAYLGLGANLGDARSTLAEALRRLGAVSGVRVDVVSSFYRTAPVDAGGPDYTNAVARIETTLPARELLKHTQAIELELGRVRPAGVHNAPRTIDIDIELYGEEAIDEPPTLLVPHPRMHERAFVLVPLLELAPGIRIPGRGKAAEFLARIHDQAIERLAPDGQ